MSRLIGITCAETTTLYRAAFAYSRCEGRVTTTVYRGLYDKPGAARTMVTKALAGRPIGLGMPADDLVDAWVEPVTIVNHPGVRYTDDWAAPADDTADRRGAIEAIASVLEDGPEDPWSLAYATRRLANGEFTVAQAREWLGEGWEEL